MNTMRCRRAQVRRKLLEQNSQMKLDLKMAREQLTRAEASLKDREAELVIEKSSK